MILLVGFYQDASAARTNELLECLRRNVDNRCLDEVRVFVEDRADLLELAHRFPVLAHAKVRLLEHGRRLRYSELFEHANRQLAGEAVVLANADIFFDETLAPVEGLSLAGRMLCLSRWDESADWVPRHFDQPNSQDAWIFEPPLPHVSCDFLLGVPGCDNRLAYEAERAGLSLSNPSRSIRARHLHLTGVRRYTELDRLHGPLRFVPASFLDPVDGSAAPASIARFPSHRGRLAERAAEERCRDIEAVVAPLIGGRVPRPLRRELRRAVAARTAGPAPAGVPLASVAFRERMGYTLARVAPGVSTHNNDPRPLVSLPPALAGLWFTQVVANHSAHVDLEWRSAGRVYVLAAPGWEGYAPAAAFLDAAGWREPFEPLRTRDGTAFHAWSLVAGAGERVTVPTQVMLASDALTRCD